jgi:hypothetical protein
MPKNAPTSNDPAFTVGQRGDKVTGDYRFPGTVVSRFHTTTGKLRYVVELDGYGLLHIFSENQLGLRP